MTFLQEVHGLTPEIKERIRQLAGTVNVHFGVDDDGCLYAATYSWKGRPERIAEGWFWDDIIRQLERAN